MCFRRRPDVCNGNRHVTFMLRRGYPVLNKRCRKKSVLRDMIKRYEFSTVIKYY